MYLECHPIDRAVSTDMLWEFEVLVVVMPPHAFGNVVFVMPAVPRGLSACLPTGSAVRTY